MVVQHPLRAVLEPLGAAVPGVLDRLFDREESVTDAAVIASVGAPALERLVDAGLVRRAGDDLVPLVRIDRVGSILLAADRHPHRRRRDFVVGKGPSGLLLARHVRPHRRGRFLDLGTGSGILALMLAGPDAPALGIDINPRAVGFARFNAALNGHARFEVKQGDFLGGTFDPHLDGRFETVVANPPFVLSPTSTVTYRDRPLAGDEVGARTVDQVARALAPGGRGYVLCNWITRRDRAWTDPVRAWTAALGVGVGIRRLIALGPAGYAAMWTRDLPATSRDDAVAAWTAELEAEGAEQIHVGVISLERPRRWRRPPTMLATVDLVPA